MKPSRVKANVSKKLIPLYILDLLEEETDENNALLPSEIIEKINKRHGEGSITKVETLLENIEAVNNYYRGRLDGVDIIQYLTDNEARYRNNKRYYLAMRRLDAAEIKLLIDIVQNTKTLGKKERLDMRTKLMSFLSFHQRNYEKAVILYDGSSKSPNRSVYINLDEIQKAIHAKQNIEFTYSRYDLQKKLVPQKRPEPYIVSPYGVMYSHGGYFLIGGHISKGLRTYRLDRITEIHLVGKNNPEYGTYVKCPVDLKSYVENAPFMYAEQNKIDVVMKCKMHILDSVIDRFENCSLHACPEDEGYFIAHITNTTKKGMKLWALQFATECELLDPPELRSEVKESLSDALKRYSE